MALVGFFSFHLLPRPGFESSSVELHRPGTFRRLLYRLSYYNFICYYYELLHPANEPTARCQEFCLHDNLSFVSNQIERHLEAGVTNALSGTKWERLADDGPKITACNRKTPLSRNYFLGNPASLKEEEDKMYGDEGKFFMAHNGEDLPPERTWRNIFFVALGFGPQLHFRSTLL